MKIKNLLYTAIASLILFSSCIQELRKDDFNDEAISGLVKIQLKMPQGYEQFSTEGMKILLLDNTSGLEYSVIADANGYAEARVAFGTYSISSESKYTENKAISIFNGMQSGLRLTPEENTANVSIDLKYSKSSQIIIKEFYYGGCQNISTGKNYAKDVYVILYNNSEEVAYLDSLCIGVAYPWNAPTTGKIPEFTDEDGNLMPGAPNSGMGWMFDGTGNDLPLQPGEEAVISLNAIDHTQITANSVNLAKPGYFTFYDPILTPQHSTPEAGVIPLKGFWKTGPSKSYVISNLSPALFIYTMGGRSIEDFITETYTENPKNPSQALSACLFVEKENVVDGVECFRNNNDTKRFIPEIDNGFIRTPGNGQGYSVHRKIDEEATAAAGDRIVYQDTNNSSNDFYVRDKASLTEN